MPTCPLVTPTTDRLTLSTGDWVDVKRELNAGEYFDYLVQLADRQPFAKLLAYVVKWSFLDYDGAPLAYDLEQPATERLAAIRHFAIPLIRELTDTLDRHEKTVDAARDAKKKTPAIALASNRTSASAGT
jgi:hypothetical protein